MSPRNIVPPSLTPQTSSKPDSTSDMCYAHLACASVTTYCPAPSVVSHRLASTVYVPLTVAVKSTSPHRSRSEERRVGKQCPCRRTRGMYEEIGPLSLAVTEMASPAVA